MAEGLLERLRAAHARSEMVGWDFSRLDRRMLADDPPWDFEDTCQHAMRGASRIVDLGTGGGERLTALCGQLESVSRKLVVATEGWLPNIDVATRALGPLGISVARYGAETGEPMPFADESFDLVMARHELYDPPEVARILSPHGRLLTQQVHGDDAKELRAWFGGEPQYPDVTLERYSDMLTDAGLSVLNVGQWTGSVEFIDAEALVEYMGMVPWVVPGFTVVDSIEHLVRLDSARPIRISQQRFWLEVSKPATASSN